MPVSQDYADYSVYGSTSLHDILMIHGEWPGRKYAIEYGMDTLTIIVSMEKLYLSIFDIFSKQEI